MKLVKINDQRFYLIYYFFTFTTFYEIFKIITDLICFEKANFLLLLIHIFLHLLKIFII